MPISSSLGFLTLMKHIVYYDPKTEEITDFPWDEDYPDPHLLTPK
jgi:hypothetical protein